MVVYEWWTFKEEDDTANATGDLQVLTLLFTIMAARNRQTSLMDKARVGASFDAYQMSCLIHGGYVLYLSGTISHMWRLISIIGKT